MADMYTPATANGGDEDSSIESLKIADKREIQMEPLKLLQKPKKCCFCYIPKRLIFVLMSFLGYTTMYALRVNLSVAIVSMAKSPVVTTTDEIKSSSSSYEQFDWNERTQGLILSSFFCGYVLTQLPGGRLADLYGSKWFFGIGVLGTSVLTLTSPFAAHLHYTVFIANRALQGVFQGIAYPTIHSMIPNWLPVYERSIGGAFIYAGTLIGTVITMPLTAIICDSTALGGWPTAFYFFGGLGLVWSVFWFWLISERPENHSTISQSELTLILENIDRDSSKSKPPVPWREVLTSVPVWALAVTHFGQNWGFYTFLTQMPRFLQQVYRMDLKQNGLVSALPYLSQAVVGCSVGFICDKLYRTQRFRMGTLRKTFNTVAFAGPTVCLFLITMSGRDETIAIVLIMIAFAINGAELAGFHVTHVDMAPNFASTLMGITNCLANFAGIFVSNVASAILDHVVMESDSDSVMFAWHYIFYVSCCLYIVTGAIFVLFGSNELQKWNDPIQTTDEEK